MQDLVPVIGIPAAHEPARFGAWEQPAALLPFSYVEAVQRAGAIALLIPPDPALVTDPSQIIARLDGLLLAGGADIDPSYYGESTGPSTGPVFPDRDATELALTRAALAAGLPILGVCRGLQILNVARGGSLIQHLPDVDGVGEQHRRHIGTFVGNEHEVALVPGSLAARVAGETIHSTLSHHHQAVGRVADGLMISGTAADGVIEAIEDPASDYCLGVQWHPEADGDSPIIATLVESARRRLRGRGGRVAAA